MVGVVGARALRLQPLTHCTVYTLEVGGGAGGRKREKERERERERERDFFLIISLSRARARSLSLSLVAALFHPTQWHMYCMCCLRPSFICCRMHRGVETPSAADTASSSYLSLPTSLQSSGHVTVWQFYA